MIYPKISQNVLCRQTYPEKLMKISSRVCRNVANRRTETNQQRWKYNIRLSAEVIKQLSRSASYHTCIYFSLLYHRMKQIGHQYKIRATLKRRNTLGCLDQYACKGLRLWNSRDHETVLVYKYMQRIETMKQSRLWSSLGTHGALVVIWWLCISSSVNPENFAFK